MKNILEYFPESMAKAINENIDNRLNKLEEIRVRVQKPIILKFDYIEKVIEHIVTYDEMLSILQLICENSIYSYQGQIAEGFITVEGGHRVGIAGSCVIENNKVINIDYINSLNFRISKQIIGCSNYILKYILDIPNNTILNTLIISSPGCGKTTILRDVVRQVSNGITEISFKGIDIGLVDERGEIASLHKGISENEVGTRTDVMENVSKSLGMRMLIRSMAPRVVVADEIGRKDDIAAIKYAMCSGCKGLFTAHGSCFRDLEFNPVLKELLDSHLLEVLIFLSEKEKGKTREIYLLNKEKIQYEII